MENIEKLKEELTKGRQEIKTDHYLMSIGELISIYKEGDLKLDPAFQRLFRWDSDQKTRFIESILLGIPIPPIFVAQNAEGKWTIVDGVQRVSTIMQFTNNLSGYTALKLESAKKLPSLEGFEWDTITPDFQRIIKRTKLGISIILTEDSIDSQYELFQRLNTGGSHLEPQEIRNCMIIMVSQDFYDQLNELKNFPSFKNSLGLNENKINIERHMELLLRYLIARRNKVDFSKYTMSKTRLDEFLDKETKELMEDEDFDLASEITLFKKVFDYISRTLKKDIFKKYDSETDKFKGPFLESTFEAVLPGMAANFDTIAAYDSSQIRKLICDLFLEEEYKNGVERGVKAITRFKKLTAFSYNYFGTIQDEV